MFGDILICVLTVFGLVPWSKLFGPKKDFRQQLAELTDERNVDSDGGDGRAILWLDGNRSIAVETLPEWATDPDSEERDRSWTTSIGPG